MIDELHNVLGGRGDSPHEFLNLLRFLGNEVRIPLTGAGTRDAYLAIRSDPQLENRALKRRISDAIYAALVADARQAAAAGQRAREGNRGTALSPGRPADTPHAGLSGKPLPGLPPPYGPALPQVAPQVSRTEPTSARPGTPRPRRKTPANQLTPTAKRTRYERLQDRVSQRGQSSMSDCSGGARRLIMAQARRRSASGRISAARRARRDPAP